MRDHLPGDADLTALPPLQDVVVQLFSHRTITEPIRVPAVLEPLQVLLLPRTARVEERGLDGPWSAATVRVGDFFLTNTQEPY
jgi:AraC family transcriptional regulator